MACRRNPLTRPQSPSEDFAEQRTVDLLMQSSDSVERHNERILSQRIGAHEIENRDTANGPARKRPDGSGMAPAVVARSLVHGDLEHTRV